MFRFLNPHFVSSDQTDAAACAPIVDAWLASQPGNKIVSLADLRAGLPAIAAKLTRPVTNQICQQIGATIQDYGDAQT